MMTITCLTTKETQAMNIGNAIQTALSAKGLLLRNSECRGIIFRKPRLEVFRHRPRRGHIFPSAASLRQGKRLPGPTTRTEGQLREPRRGSWATIFLRRECESTLQILGGTVFPLFVFIGNKTMLCYFTNSFRLVGAKRTMLNPMTNPHKAQA